MATILAHRTKKNYSQTKEQVIELTMMSPSAFGVNIAVVSLVLMATVLVSMLRVAHASGEERCLNHGKWNGESCECSEYFVTGIHNNNNGSSSSSSSGEIIGCDVPWCEHLNETNYSGGYNNKECDQVRPINGVDVHCEAGWQGRLCEICTSDSACGGGDGSGDYRCNRDFIVRKNKKFDCEIYGEDIHPLIGTRMTIQCETVREMNYGVNNLTLESNGTKLVSNMEYRCSVQTWDNLSEMFYCALEQCTAMYVGIGDHNSVVEYACKKSDCACAYVAPRYGCDKFVEYTAPKMKGGAAIQCNVNSGMCYLVHDDAPLDISLKCRGAECVKKSDEDPRIDRASIYRTIMEVAIAYGSWISLCFMLILIAFNCMAVIMESALHNQRITKEYRSIAASSSLNGDLYFKRRARNLRVEDLSYQVEGKRRGILLKDVNIEILPRKMIGIMGGCGSGKTTLLSVISQRMLPLRSTKHEGLISYDDDEVLHPSFRRSTGFTFSKPSFPDHLSTRELVNMCCRMRAVTAEGRAGSHERDSLARKAMMMMNVSGLSKIMPGVTIDGRQTVSDGQMKCIDIACELATDPEILFLDEPTSGLDSDIVYSFMGHCMKIKENGKTIVMNIHQPNTQIFHMFDSVIWMKDGHVIAQKSPQDSIDYFMKLLERERVSGKCSELMPQSITDTMEKQDLIIHMLSKMPLDSFLLPKVAPRSSLDSLSLDMDRMERRRKGHRMTRRRSRAQKLRKFFYDFSYICSRILCCACVFISRRGNPRFERLSIVGNYYEHERYSDSDGSGDEEEWSMIDIDRHHETITPLSDGYEPRDREQRSNERDGNEGDDDDDLTYDIDAANEKTCDINDDDDSDSFTEPSIVPSRNTTTSDVKEQGESGTDDLRTEAIEHRHSKSTLGMTTGNPLIDEPYFSQNDGHVLSYMDRLNILIWYNMLYHFRKPRLIIFHLLVSLIGGIGLGTLYWQQDINFVGCQNRLGSMMFAMCILGFTSISGVEDFVERRLVYTRHIQNAYYKPYEYVTAKNCVDMLLLKIVPVVFMVSIYYVAIGLRSDFSYYLVHLLAMIMFNVCSSLMNSAVGAISQSVGVGMIVSVLFTIVNMLFAGIMANLKHLPLQYSWIKYLCYWRYVYEVLASLEFHDQIIVYDPEGEPPRRIRGDLLLRQFNMNPRMTYTNIGVIIQFIIVFWLMSTWLLKRRLSSTN